MKLIGISGLKGSGKDTAYELIDNYVTRSYPSDPQYRVERRAFADKLKIAAAGALGFDGDDEYLIDLMNEAKEKWDLKVQKPVEAFTIYKNYEHCIWHEVSGREYLQNFGLKARELFGESFWVDQILPESRSDFEKVWRTQGRVGAIAGMPAIGCVTDVRFPNEAERILNLGGTMLEIIRPGLESDGHDSEIPLPEEFITARVVNDSSKAELAKNLEFIVESV